MGGWDGEVLGYHRLCESKLKESDNLEPISVFFFSSLFCINKTLALLHRFTCR